MANLATQNAHEGQLTEEEARTVTLTPRVDVLETEDEFLVFADLPGVKPEDVDIRFEKGELTVHGQRPPAHLGKEPALREYEATSYHRAFGVAETIAADKITAELKNGVLTVRLPKVEAVKPKRIAVKG
ncbi:MAG TPA: Hsp20/alpha crystallin family protein [Gemmataceae bacterium]|nr:Hsp20/alpha crystallin family protein [Gemmataceae bacterium]